MPKNARLLLNRREAIGLLGASAGAGLVSAFTGEVPLAALQQNSAAIIRTVLADVPPDALGTGATMFHEHMSLKMRGMEERQKFYEDIDLIVDEVRAAGQDGVSCLVDSGHADMGRSLEALRQIATRSGVHIVASGGFWLQRSYPPEIASKSEDELVEELVRDAHAERWGALGEIGTSNKTTPDERKVLRAIGKTTVRTALAVYTHTPYHGGGCEDGPGGACALGQLDTLESVGAAPEKVCIGHLSDFDEPGAKTANAIAARGAFVGFDTVGRPMRGDALPESKKLQMVLAVLEAGHEDYVLLSQDLGDRNWLKSVGSSGYSNVLQNFIPKLRYAGVNEATIRKLLVDNPRRFLAFVPKA